jgi:hypothetical protein
MGTSDFVEAEADIKKGLGSEPNNADLQALHKKLKVRERKGLHDGVQWRLCLRVYDVKIHCLTCTT